MREDSYIDDVLGRCDALKRAGLWPAEPKLQPRSWLNNFEEADRTIAATLLDRFEYYNDTLTSRLFAASFKALGDGFPRTPTDVSRQSVLRALENAVYTPVEGEAPNLTDSGRTFCRHARQVLLVPEDRILDPIRALQAAASVDAVVFIDDFVGSGEIGRAHV